MISKAPFKYTCTIAGIRDGRFWYTLKLEGKHDPSEAEQISGDLLLVFNESRDIAIGESFELAINKIDTKT